MRMTTYYMILPEVCMRPIMLRSCFTLRMKIFLVKKYRKDEDERLHSQNLWKYLIDS